MADPGIRQESSLSEGDFLRYPAQDSGRRNPTEPLSPTRLFGSTITSEPKSLKSESKPNHILSRLTPRSPGIKDLAMRDLEKRKRADKTEAKARKDAEARERKHRKDQEDREREEERKLTKERAQQNKAVKADRRAEEKRVKDYYGIRGFDPSAGMLRSERDEMPRTPEGFKNASRSSRTDGEGQHWGVEFGRPEHHLRKGHFSGGHESCGQRYED